MGGGHQPKKVHLPNLSFQTFRCGHQRGLFTSHKTKKKSNTKGLRLKRAIECTKVYKNTVNFYHVNKKKYSVRIRSLVKLYMKVRIHHALKMCNMNNSEKKSGKCNRKMLKHSHSKHKI